MNIHTIDTHYSQLLNKRMEYEGDVIGSIENADLILTDIDLVPFPSTGIVIGGGVRLIGESIFHLGMDLAKDDNEGNGVYVSKWFDCEKGWHPQTLVQIPVIGLMAGGLSETVPMGIGSRYVQDEKISKLFLSTGLEDMLKELRYRGFVELHMRSKALGISKVRTGLSLWGICNVMEAIPGKISNFFIDPFSNILKESWTISLLVTVYPWPLKVDHSYTAEGLTRGVSKHLWVQPESRIFKQCCTFDKGILGVVTAWGDTLSIANQRALTTCWAISLDRKQFRLDANRSIEATWWEYKELHGLAL